RLTDPEVLEYRFPVQLEEFSIRHGSGGQGQYGGGNGVIRKLKFLEPMNAGILSDRRTIAPQGLNGGGNGQPGKNYVLKANGETLMLPSQATIAMEAGDTIAIETPGGGGFGSEPGP
ncbi:MAG: 5-oxoprolinase, partial [Synechococcaceae cyanobacterium RL_1_2]|nr:5-oxoprolinase [Synechococcaceae cyanobacterium RL_1_2]